MSHTLYAAFDNRDAADMAASRLRRKGIPFRFAVEAEPGSSRLWGSSAPAAVDLLFPGQMADPGSGQTGYLNVRLPGRALLTSDVMGLPLYAGGGETRVRVTVDDEHFDEARALLRNCGARSLRQGEVNRRLS